MMVRFSKEVDWMVMDMAFGDEDAYKYQCSACEKKERNRLMEKRNAE
jgi:hypothetical protein